MSTLPIESALAECVHWDIFDANVYVGHSGINGALALEAPELLLEMDRFAIKRALVSHFVSHEYDAVEGNRALERDADPRFVPAWSSSPDSSSLADIEPRAPRAVRCGLVHCTTIFRARPGARANCWSICRDKSVLTLISRPEIEWDAIATLLENFPRLNVLLLDIGYRSDRYLFPLLKNFRICISTARCTWLIDNWSGTWSTSGPIAWYLAADYRSIRQPRHSWRSEQHAFRTPARLAVAGENLRRLIGESA